MKILIIVVVLLAIVGAYALIKTKMMNPKFEWRPGSSAPKLYPATIHKGDLLYEDGSIYIPSDAFITDGWGDCRSVHVVGEDFKPVPDKLGITWFSFLENKFYTGLFELPKERMTRLFREGFTSYNAYKDTQEHLTYSEIIVGMAPGGVVVVWMQGPGHYVEIGRYQCRETVVSMKEWMPEAGEIPDSTRAEWVKDYISSDTLINENFAEHGIPFGLWDTYRERFDFRPRFHFPVPEGERPTYILMEFFNGELWGLSGESLHKNDYIPSARIKRTIFFWRGNNNELQKSEAFFDEEEVFKAYDFVTNGEHSVPVELKIEIIPTDEKRITLYLVGHGKDNVDTQYQFKLTRIDNFILDK